VSDDTAPRNPNDTPKVRTWTVPTTFVNEQGEEVPAVDNAQMALNEVAILLMRVGGVVSIVAKRIELPPQGRYAPRHETELLVIRWQSHSPVMPKVEPAAPKVEVGGAAAAGADSE
jgi:hypothetical protein